MQSVKNGFAPPFSLCFSKSRAARQSPFCKAVARPFQSRRKALPKSTKTGRKSVGFLILTQAPKCTRSHCFPPQKHPKNGFMMRFAGKNSFFQLRARDFSFYMNAYNRACGPVRRARRGVILNEKGVLHPFFKLFPRTFLLPLCLLQPSAAPSVKRALFSYSPRYGSVCPMPLAWARAAHSACISAAYSPPLYRLA